MRRLVFLVFVLLASCRRPPQGPPPEGTRILSGVVTSFDVSADGRVLISEIRGRHAKAGDARERVIAMIDGKEEELGRGAMLPQVSPDGQWLVWLASKERASRMGPAKLRAAKGGAVFDLGAGMPPFVFAGSRVLFLTAFSAASGRGTLVSFEGGAGVKLIGQVPPDAFVPVRGGVLAIEDQRSRTTCRAVYIVGVRPDPIIDHLDCDDPALPFVATESVAWMRVAPDANGKRKLVRWSPGEIGTKAVADDVDAMALDATGALWSAAEDAGRVSVRRDGAEIASVEGRFVRAVHPVPGGGAWVTLADRSCVGASASPTPACFRFVAAGAPAPPSLSVVRRVDARTWPLTAFVGESTPPDLLAVFDPAKPVVVKGPTLASDVSASGRWLALRRHHEEGESVALLDLASGAERILSTGAPEAGEVRFEGEILYYTWKNRKQMSDARNGLYRVDPAAAGVSRADQ